MSGAIKKTVDDLLADLPGGEEELLARVSGHPAGAVAREIAMRLPEITDRGPIISLLLLNTLGVEGAEKELLAVMRNHRVDPVARAVAYLVLLDTASDSELERLGRNPEAVIDAARTLSGTVMLAGSSSPFSAYLDTDPADLAAIRSVIERVIAAFVRSAEAAHLPETRGMWARLVLENVHEEYGTLPIVLVGDELEDILVAGLREPLKTNMGRAPEVIPEARAFFLWMQRVVGSSQEHVLEVLDDLEPDYAELLEIEEENDLEVIMERLGGKRGFDMQSDAGRMAFLDSVINKPPSTPSHKQDVKKKAKRQMEKATRKKNRRR